MTDLDSRLDAPYVDAAARLAQRLTEGRDEYLAAQPWPHLVLQDALPADLTRSAYQQVVSGELEPARTINDRRQVKWEQPNVTGAAATILSILESAPIVSAIGALLGIDDLVSDPTHTLAGLQVTPIGGATKVHVDFYRHPKTQLFHRANVLLYITEEWQESYGGSLEMWPADMKALGRKLVPRFNQLLLFETNDHSPHGMPDPVNCEGPGRAVLSSYYYSPTASIVPESRKLTPYRARPQDSKLDGMASAYEIKKRVFGMLPAPIRKRIRSGK
jgi:Rps23 Pro-64 3,4-dihydroxylase Tpa1-like proline 4-hydroxylase